MTAPLSPIRDDLFAVTPEGMRLVVGACRACGDLHFPRTDTCPYCGEGAETYRIGPVGVLRLCTIVQRPPPGYLGPVPYGFGIVEVANTRLEIVSRLVASDLDALVPGTPVRLVLESLPIDTAGTRAVTWAFETTR